MILYHGSASNFNQFDYSKRTNKGGSDFLGAGYYFTPDKNKARMFGDNIYTVEVSYSTDFRTAKKTGRTKDFVFNKDLQYMKIPVGFEKNLKILKKEYIGE